MMNAATDDTTNDTTTGPEALPLTATDARERRIVVAVDGSDSSIDALRKAVELAGPLTAAVEAVSVWQYPAAVVDTYPSSLWTPEEDAQATLNAAAATVFGESIPAWFSTSIRS
ncbi:MAG TPA: universal stress protein, partial [Glaciihabitans sp.]|nr:universal stress protein [Glaciihabitans sp.]